MYTRLVSFTLRPGKESVTAGLGDDLLPQIREQPGCREVTLFGDTDGGQCYLQVLWDSREEADAAAVVIAPKLAQRLNGNTVTPYEAHLYPVIASA